MKQKTKGYEHHDTKITEIQRVDTKEARKADKTARRKPPEHTKSRRKRKHY